MLVLTEADVRDASDMALAVSRVHEALLAYSGGRTDTPVRSEIRSMDPAMLALFMPAHVPQAPALGCKLIAEFPTNRDRGLPVLTGSLLLLDPETGFVDTLMSATHLTNLRTGALTAVAVRALAPEGSRRAAVLGTGGLSTLQAIALAHVLRLDEIRIWGRRPDAASAAADRIARARPAGDPRIVVCEGARQAVEGAEVVVTATSAREPLVESAWLGDDVLLCAVGSNAPHMQELPSDLVGDASRVLVDSRAGVLTRAGDLTAPIAEGRLDPDTVLELGEVLANAPDADGRRGRTVFKSCGFAALDMALAAGIRDRASADRIGTSFDLGQQHG